MKTQITIFCTFLFIIFFFVSNAQEPDTLKPIYLEGTDINVAGISHHAPLYPKIKDSIVYLNNLKYKIYDQQVYINDINIRAHYQLINDLIYTDTLPVKYQTKFISRFEYFDLDGTSIFKFSCNNIPEECLMNIFLNFENHSAIVQDKNIRFFNNKGVEIKTYRNINYSDLYVNDSKTFVFYKKNKGENKRFGIANFSGDLFWEKDYLFTHSYYIDISDLGHLLIQSNDTIFSYNPKGELIWKKPSFETFHPYNSDGSLLITSDRTPRLIDNKTGNFIPTKIREELNSLGNPQLSHQRKFIPDSDLFAVLAYYKTHEEILIFNTNGKCIAKKKIDKKYITEDSSILRYRKNENIISVLQNGQVIDKIILNE